MKTRNGLVSNSSSSSFIIQTKDLPQESYLGIAIVDNCFCLNLDGLKDPSVWPKDIVKNKLWIIDLPQLESNDVDEAYSLDLNPINEDSIFEVLNLIKQYCTSVTLY